MITASAYVIAFCTFAGCYREAAEYPVREDCRKLQTVIRTQEGNVSSFCVTEEGFKKLQQQWEKTHGR